MMFDNFVENLSKCLNTQNSKTKIPSKIKRFIFLLEGFSFSRYRAAIAYNSTVKFTVCKINGENILNENIIVAHKPYLFLYSSEISIGDDISFAFSWNNLTKKVLSKTNRKLSEYLSEILGKQAFAVLSATELFSPTDIYQVFNFVGNTLQKNLESNTLQIGNNIVELNMKNTLYHILGNYVFQLRIYHK